MAFNEAMIGLIALLGGLTAIAMLFVVNLACAPFRLQRETANSLRTELEAERQAHRKLKNEMAVMSVEGPRLSASIDISIWGGRSKQLEGVVLCLWLVIRNTGTRPSAAEDFAIIISRDGHESKLNLIHSETPIELSATDNSRTAVLPTEQAIYNVTADAIQPGELKRGFAFTVISDPRYSEPGSEVSVIFKDVNGEPHRSGPETLGEGQSNAHAVGMGYTQT